MLAPITIRYPFRPARRSLATGRVADLFGLADDEPPHTVAENVAARRPARRPGAVHRAVRVRQVVAAAGRGGQLGAVDAAALDLPDVPLIDAPAGAGRGPAGDAGRVRAVRGPAAAADAGRAVRRAAVPVPDRLRCRPGLGGERRTTHAPSVLLPTSSPPCSTGRWRRWWRSTCGSSSRRTGVGVLAATTHDDLADDLNPDLWVRCRGDGRVEVGAAGRKKKRGQLRRRAVAVGRHPIRLAVLRSVALPQPPPRVRPPGDPAVARRPSRSASACSAPRPRRWPCGRGTSG